MASRNTWKNEEYQGDAEAQDSNNQWDEGGKGWEDDSFHVLRPRQDDGASQSETKVTKGDDPPFVGDERCRRRARS